MGGSLTVQCRAYILNGDERNKSPDPDDKIHRQAFPDFFRTVIGWRSNGWSLERGRVKAGGKSVNLNSITKYQKTTCSCSAEESYKVPSSSLKDRGFFRHNSISFFCATFVSRLGPIFTKSNSSPDDCLVDIKLLSQTLGINLIPFPIILLIALQIQTILVSGRVL